MKLLIFSLIFIVSNLSCQNRTKKFEKEEVVFWEKFEKALLMKDISFLLKNSLAEIQCGECGIMSDSIEWFPSDFLMNNSLNTLIPPEDTEFSISNEIIEKSKIGEKRIYRVIYVLSKESIIYTIEKKKNNFFFQGKISVP